MRPLLILDCDEVLLRFAEPFRLWLDETQGISLAFETFSLGGLTHKADGSPVESTRLPLLLDGFFAEAQPRQTLVPGVAEALGRLADQADIVVLTNIHDRHRETRARCLQLAGLELPVHANDGPKGPAVARLAAGRRAVFVDDLPPHHASVAAEAPHVFRLHMVAEPVLRPLIPAAPHAHERIDDWARAEPWIVARLEEA